jgi:hypothetical protein
MKIDPDSDPSDRTDPHEPSTDVIRGIREELGDNHPTTSSPVPLEDVSSVVPLEDVLGKINALVSALSLYSSTDLDAFLKDKDASKVVAELNALLHVEKEDKGEGEGAG